MPGGFHGKLPPPATMLRGVRGLLEDILRFEMDPEAQGSTEDLSGSYLVVGKLEAIVLYIGIGRSDPGIALSDRVPGTSGAIVGHLRDLWDERVLPAFKSSVNLSVLALAQLIKGLGYIAVKIHARQKRDCSDVPCGRGGPCERTRFVKHVHPRNSVLIIHVSDVSETRQVV